MNQYKYHVSLLYCNSTWTQWALEQAKRNVEKDYLFVGLIEEYDATLKILEHLAPDLFKNLLSEYRKPKEGKIV